MFVMRKLSVFALVGLLAMSAFLIVGRGGLSWGDDPGANLVNADPKNIDVVDVTDHPPTVPVVFGSSQLLRTKEGVAFKLDTTGLAAGTGYTLWVFIDENDNNLPGPPGLERFELRIQMGGEFAAPDGTGQFSSFLPAGAFPTANGINVLADDDGFFDDPQKADIILIVRWHGPLVPALAYQQTHFINGGLPGGPPNMSVQEALHIGDHSQNHRKN